ncbi:FlgN family protein [Shewanella sediminis HAW-EB3]|uniref:FlgN family protein n=1 Tax=Shewanella sediminis (strain HAW-EB3) TaxID=425104 RepID=A8FXX3_SHESH|nr:flagellar protein FlgN [Shewanella sediminis]ABV37696.1 FlgN family protein [Shewanella sediminis HAW-EB3]
MSQITNIIELQHKLLEELKVTITQEKSALIEQSADLLLSLATAKAKLLDDLKANDVNLSTHPEKSLLISDSVLSAKVNSAKELLAECQQLNIENTSLIELNIASINRLSQALQVSRNASSLTYNGKGKTSTISTLGNNLKA